MLLRRKGLVPATTLLELCFRLFRCADKLLRKTLYNYIIHDIKRVNAKHKNARLNIVCLWFSFTTQNTDCTVLACIIKTLSFELLRRLWLNFSC